MAQKDTKTDTVHHDVLSIKGVDISYGGDNVVNDVNLTVKPGQFFGLIGLNGAGKTTIIKTILGLKELSAGEISLYGRGRSDKTAKKNLAYLPERFEPPWFLSGIEFLRFSADLYGRKLDDEIFYKGADSLGLERAALKRKVHTYSKGMRQKLGLLGTVYTGCDFMILDEPMSGLDPKARAGVKDLLIATKDQGHTIFLSSHILADMDELCDEVAVLHDTHIKFKGTPSELKKQTKAENLERAFLHYIEKDKAA